MKKCIIILICASFSLLGSKCFASDLGVGFVNFKSCVEKSKSGQKEKTALESMRSQMTQTLEKTDKELEEIAKKLEDQDYMDSLSPTAEEELKAKFQNLSQDFARYQNQYYQLLNQANYKMLQLLHDEVSSASENVRVSKNLSLILNEDSIFAHVSVLDFTDEVIKEMDKHFETENNEVVSQQ